MKRKIFSILFALVLVVSFSLVPSTPAMANSVTSSTMIFQGSLTYDAGTGTYSGVLPMVDEAGSSLGDLVAGYDLYAKEGATAWFGDDPGGGPVWTSTTIASHDAWPNWPTDTPDWYQYSLNLTQDGGGYKWAVRNHPGATAANPWSSAPGTYTPAGVPMSGTMDWAAMYAAETDTGAYLPGTGTPEISGGAASKGGGPGYWDMDWSWGSEAVPLQFPGFDVAISSQGGGVYRVTLTPAAAGATHLTATVPDIVAISVNPTSIDFGSLIPGQTSSVENITVENVGTHEVDVDADVSGSGGELFYDNLELRNYTQSGSYSTRDWLLIVDDLVMDASEELRTKITVPSNYTPGGSETATLTFTATGT